MSQVVSKRPRPTNGPTPERKTYQDVGESPVKTSSVMGFFFAGLAPSISIMVTSPVDVVKVRMQSYGECPKSKYIPTSSFSVLRDIVKTEGFTGLYRGISVSLVREASLNTIRLGLFDPLMSLMHKDYRNITSCHETGLPPLWKRLLCGSICGVAGSFASNPMELIKCRLQCAGETATGYSYNYRGGIDAFSTIIKSNGVRGLWTGSGVFMLRNAVGTAANLSTFTTLKAFLLQHYENTITIDIASGLASGFVTTCVMCPLDMIKTRVQNQPIDTVTGKGQHYRNFVHAARKIVATEGTVALYKGFNSLFFRTGPHYILTFAILGVLQRWMQSRASNLQESNRIRELCSRQQRSDRSR